MSVQTQIERIVGIRDDSFDALSEKDVSVPTGSKLEDIPALIRAIKAGGGAVTGTVTFSDKTWIDNTDYGTVTKTTIEHGLGRVPVGFARVLVRTSQSGESETEYISPSEWRLNAVYQANASGTSYSGTTRYSAPGASGTNIDATSYAQVWTGAEATETTINITFPSESSLRKNMYIKGGCTYLWVAW